VEGDEPVKVLAVAPDGRWLAAPGKDWTVQVWDVTSNHRMAVLTDTQTSEVVEGRLRKTRSYLRSVMLAVSSDGQWLAVGADPGRL
jgi:WD40 repeat protein